MPPNRRNSGTAGRSSARNSPCPALIRSKTLGSNHLRTSSSGRVGSGGRGAGRAEGRTKASTTATSPAGPRRSPEPDPVAERLDRRPVQHHLAAAGQVLRLGQGVHQGARQHVDQLDVVDADDESPRPAHRDSDLETEAHDPSAWGGPLADCRHQVLHGQGARHGVRAVVTVDPGGHGVAAEVDDVAAVPVQLGEQRVDDRAERRGQLLGTALRTELGNECLGQRGEAGDVGEQRRTLDPVRQRAALRQGSAAGHRAGRPAGCRGPSRSGPAVVLPTRRPALQWSVMRILACAPSLAWTPRGAPPTLGRCQRSRAPRPVPTCLRSAATSSWCPFRPGQS